MKILTIFTPTYNRKKHLTKLYDSLTRQSSKGIKWMIIDDGSVDNTKSVVENWKSKGIIEIEYYRQENQGKHIAMKTAIQHCTTDWFLCVDSDDTLSDHAVSDMYQDILCAPTDPSFLGYIYPRKMNDSDKRNAFVEDQMINIMDAKNIYKILETAILFKIDCLRKLKIPQFENEKFLSEEVLYIQLAKQGKFCAKNRMFYISEYQESGLTRNLMSLWKKNPRGTIRLLNDRYDFANSYPFMTKWWLRIKCYLNIVALCRICKLPLGINTTNHVLAYMLYWPGTLWAKIRFRSK